MKITRKPESFDNVVVLHTAPLPLADGPAVTVPEDASALTADLLRFQNLWKSLTLAREDAHAYFGPASLPDWFLASLPPRAFCDALAQARVADGYPSAFAAAAAYKREYGAPLLAITAERTVKGRTVVVTGTWWGCALTNFVLPVGDFLACKDQEIFVCSSTAFLVGKVSDLLSSNRDLAPTYGSPIADLIPEGAEAERGAQRDSHQYGDRLCKACGFEYATIEHGDDCPQCGTTN